MNQQTPSAAELDDIYCCLVCRAPMPGFTPTYCCRQFDCGCGGIVAIAATKVGKP